MTYKCVKENFIICDFDRVRKLYHSNGCENVTVDESDLVIFRLMGAQFEYASIEFEESSPAVLLAESVVS
jgi:hypothetical protein